MEGKVTISVDEYNRMKDIIEKKLVMTYNCPEGMVFKAISDDKDVMELLEEISEQNKKNFAARAEAENEARNLESKALLWKERFFASIIIGCAGFLLALIIMGAALT